MIDHMATAPVNLDAPTSSGSRCNQSIGEQKGTTSMTQTTDTTPDVPLPFGAEPDLWVHGQRDVYAQIGYVPVSPDLLKCPAVTLVAEQFADGRLGCIDVNLDVALGASHSGMSGPQARELAALLIAGADLADRWAR